MCKALGIVRTKRDVVAVVAVVLGIALILAAQTAAFGLARGTAFSRCGATKAGWGVVSDVRPIGGISDITVTGLDPSSCNGLTGQVRLLGNTSGDQDLPARIQLGTLESNRDACSGAKRDHSIVVRDGTLTLPTCPLVGAGAAATVHAVTVFVVTIGARTGVLGERRHRGGGSNDGGSSSSGSTLPFTGSWAALTFWVGLLSALAGVVLVGAAHRRGGHTA